MNNETNNNTNGENNQSNVNNEVIKPIVNNENSIDESINNVTPTPLKPMDQMAANGVNIEENKPKGTMQSTSVQQTPTQVQPKTEVQARVQPQPQVHAQTQVKAQPQVQAQVKPQPQAQPQVQPQPQPQAQISVEQRTEVQSQSSTTQSSVQPAQTSNQNINVPNVTNEVPMQPVNQNISAKEQVVIPNLTTEKGKAKKAVDQTNIGFVATGKPLKKKKNPKVIASLVISILLVLGAAFYFFIYPWMMQKFFNDPKTLFTNVIKEVAKEANTVFDDTIHNKGIMDIKLSLDTNIQSLQEFSGYTYGIKAGVDPEQKTNEFGYSILNHNSKEEYSQYYYLKNDAYYKRYSTNRDLLYLTSIDDNTANKIFESISSVENDIGKSNSEDYKYIVNKISDSLISSIDETKITKEEFSFNVNNTSVKAIRNKYSMNKELIDKTINGVVDSLLNDDKAVSILTELLKTDKDKLKETLKITVPDDANLEISIITVGTKMSVVGYEINYKDNLNITYYSNNGDFDLNIKVKGTFNNETKEIVSVVKGIKDKDKTNITVTIDDKQIASFVVYKWTDEEKVFDYSIIDSENKTIMGSISLKIKRDPKYLDFSLEFSIKNEETNLDLALDINYDWSSEVANINTAAAQQKTEEELKSLEITFNQYIANTPLGVLFQTISGETDPDINDYYDNENNSEIIDGGIIS